MEIARAVNGPRTDDAWMELVARSGRVCRAPLGRAVVRELDVRRFWSPPHLAAAQALSAQIPHLALGCDPSAAVRWGRACIRPLAWRSIHDPWRPWWCSSAASMR